MKKLFKFNPIGLLIWVWLFLVLGVGVATSYLLAILIHELGHYFVAKKLGYKLSRFAFSPYGVELAYFQQNFHAADEIKIALAGPVANLISAFMIVGVWWLQPAAYVFSADFVVVSTVLALMNLLPCYPLDGGRVFIATSAQHCSKGVAKKITKIFNIVFALVFFALFVIFMFINFNPTFFLFSFFLIAGLFDLNLSSKFEKINIFTKNIKNFERPNFVLVDGSVMLRQILAKMETAKTQIFVLQLENGRLVCLSEKIMQKLAINYPLNTKLKEIIK